MALIKICLCISWSFTPVVLALAFEHFQIERPLQRLKSFITLKCHPLMKILGHYNYRYSD